MTIEDTTPTASRLVVLLGGGGFIGRHVCRMLLARGHAVRVLDKARGADASARGWDPGVEVVEGDFANERDVLTAQSGADTVVHLVHTTVPGSSMRDPVYDVTSNVAASVAWLGTLERSGVRRVLFCSSGGTVYGIPRTIPIDEDHPTDPISSYGISKLAIEKYVAMYGAIRGVSHVIMRPSNVYGPGQRLGRGQGLIGVLIHRAMRGEELEVWGDGRSVRDYLFVEDMAAAVVSLLDYEGPHRLFNVSSGTGHSVLDIIAEIERRLDRRVALRHVAERGYDVPVNVLSPARLQRETGWRPVTPLDVGIAQTIAWFADDAGGRRG